MVSVNRIAAWRCTAEVLILIAVELSEMSDSPLRLLRKFDMKRVVMAECARRGLPTSDDNTADAIAVLDYAAVTLAAKFR